MRAIKTGDFVLIEHATPQERSSIRSATVISTPSDTGDMWYVQSGDLTIAINPQCCWLVSITKGYAEPT